VALTCAWATWQEEPNNKDLVAEAKKAEAIKAKIEKREQERKEAEAKREAENNKLLAVLKKKGIQMGAPSFNTQVIHPPHQSGVVAMQPTC
jgi:hypothetical protein